MKNFKLILILFCIYNSGSDAQWIQQNSGTTNSLHSIKFINIYTGWTAGGSGTILKTTNGGINWISQTTGTTITLMSLNTIDGVNIWVVGTNGLILKSTDGGVTWVPKSSGTTNYLRSVFFINSNTGWAAGDASIQKTTNGGENWFSLPNSFGIPVFTVHFFNVSTGIIAGGPSIMKTTNGGLNWITVQFYCCHSLISTFFTNTNTGWAVGFLTYPNPRHAEALKTIDNGSNWNGLTTPTSDLEYYSVFFTNTNVGWISGHQGLIIKSENGGTNWYHQLSGTSAGLLSIHFVNDMTGWISGANGIILKTTNGGEAVGITQIGSEIPKEFNLYNNYPNPFNPVTRIKYDVPSNVKSEKSNVKIIVYDILGREIETLVNEAQKPGSYEVTWDGSHYASGVYFYRLYVDDASAPLSITKKMVLIK